MRAVFRNLRPFLLGVRGAANRWGFVALFFAVTLAPLIQTVVPFISVQPILENRRLAPWLKQGDGIDAAPAIIDRWYGDHFGFRPWLIRFKTQFDYSLFHQSDRVLIGKDGQLFYRSVVLSEEPRMEQLLATEEQPALDGIEKLCRALHDKGVRCAFVTPLMSDRYYPELLPGDVPTQPEHPRIYDFLSKLAKLPDVLYVDADAIQRQTIKSRRIFHRTDFHWNDPAAFEVGKALVDDMAKAEGMPSPWRHQLEITTERNSGGIAMFMPLFAPPREDSLMAKRTWALPAGFKEVDKTGPYDYVIKTDPDPKLLPSTFVMGDSFFDGMQRAGFVAQFNQLTRIRRATAASQSLADIVAAVPPNAHWFIFEFIEVAKYAIDYFADAKSVDAAVAVVNSRDVRDAQ